MHFNFGKETKVLSRKQIFLIFSIWNWERIIVSKLLKCFLASQGALEIDICLSGVTIAKCPLDKLPICVSNLLHNLPWLTNIFQEWFEKRLHLIYILRLFWENLWKEITSNIYFKIILRKSVWETWSYIHLWWSCLKRR